MFPPEPRFEHSNGQVTESIIDSAEQVNLSRSQEIMGKAVSSMLLLLLKWFRVSRTSTRYSATALVAFTNAVYRYSSL